MVRWHAMADADFAWLLGEGPAQAAGMMLGEESSSPEIMAMLRDIANRLEVEAGGPVAWLIVSEGKAAGMISFTRRGADGRYEIGYGMAPAYEKRGLMTEAIGILLPLLARQGHDGLTAETSVDNPGSQHVLARNGFVRTGERDDPDDGALVTWAIDLTSGTKA